jgi:hypothetical protein
MLTFPNELYLYNPTAQGPETVRYLTQLDLWEECTLEEMTLNWKPHFESLCSTLHVLLLEPM